MIAVDTNIVIRLLTRDDASQYKRALALFQTEDVFIADTVVLESEWVLRYAYDFSAEKICGALLKLFGLKNVHLTSPQAMAQAIDQHRKGLDFADAIHLSKCQSCDTLYTFDKTFAAKAGNNANCPAVLA